MSKNKKNNKKSKFERIKKIVSSDRFKYSLGAILLFFSVFLTLAFISYLFTWKIDQSKLDLPFGKLLASSDIVVENWSGKTGAMLAKTFIYDWFGLASFSFIFVFIVLGLRLWNIKLLPLNKTLKYTVVLTIWFSFSLGFLFGDSYFHLGGAHGYFMSKWFSSFAGSIGTVFLIIVSLFVFLITANEKFLANVSALFGKNIEKDSDEDNVEDKDSEKDEPKEDGAVDIDIVKNKEEENKLEDENVKELDIEEKPKEEKTEKKDDGDVEMTVEKIKEEEEEEEEVTNKPVGDYDPTLDLSLYKYPSSELLEDYKSDTEVTEEELNSNKDKIVETLNNYKIKIDKIKATIGPTITLYEIVPAAGVRISKIKNLEDDIALSLSALGIRIIAPIPGRGTVGIEVPNQTPQIVSMRSVIRSKVFRESKHQLPVVLGRTISNDIFSFDLTSTPHLLVAGATGQGKSVGINAIITSLLYKKHPSQVKFVLVDPKMVEMSIYSSIEKHFLAKLPEEEKPIITDTDKVVSTLNSITKEMDERYKLLMMPKARNIKEYNAKFIKRKLNPNEGHRYLPYIVVIIDEFADLIMTAGKEVEMPIARIAQKARAVGIHLIIATQRPSTNIITGVIKANFPARIAFKVTSMVDSRTILDSPGANQLIGRGDLLFSQGSDMVRVQCAFVDTPEVERVTNHIAEQQSYPSAFILPEPDAEESSVGEVKPDERDSMFEEAARVIVSNQQGSTSLIQRKLKLGYNRAGRIIDQLEAAGVVGPYEGSKARKVLIPDEYALEQFLNNLDK